MKPQQFLPSIMLIMAGLMPALAAENNPPLIVGITEDLKTDDASSAMSTIHVRAAFQKLGKEWIPFEPAVLSSVNESVPNPRAPTELEWTVVFDGKRIGTIISASRGPSDWYWQKGVLPITSNLHDVPKIATGANSFSLLVRFLT